LHPSWLALGFMPVFEKYIRRGKLLMWLRGVILLMSFSLAPLVNAEDYQNANNFSGSIALGGYKTEGNTQTATFDGKFKLGHSYGKWSSEAVLKATQVSESGIVSSDYYEALLKSIYDLPQHFYTFLQLRYREDTFGGIYSENTYIGGFGYHAFKDNPDYSLDIELGYGERVTKKLIDGVIRDKLDYDPGTHIGIIGKYSFTENDALKINLSGEFGNDDDYIQKEISWVHQLFGAVHADLTYESRTVTRPGVGKVPTDEKITVKLGYTF